MTKFTVNIKIYKSMPYKNDDGTERNTDADIVYVVYRTDCSAKEIKKLVKDIVDKIKTFEAQEQPNDK